MALLHGSKSLKSVSRNSCLVKPPLLYAIQNNVMIRNGSCERNYGMFMSEDMLYGVQCFLLAETSVRPPQKLFMFVILKGILEHSVQKTYNLILKTEALVG